MIEGEIGLFLVVVYLFVYYFCRCVFMIFFCFFFEELGSVFVVVYRMCLLVWKWELGMRLVKWGCVV